MEYHISDNDLKLLQNINEALGEIYTKGSDTFVIANTRWALSDIIKRAQKSAHIAEEPIEINLNDIKEE